MSAFYRLPQTRGPVFFFFPAGGSTAEQIFSGKKKYEQEGFWDFSSEKEAYEEYTREEEYSENSAPDAIGRQSSDRGQDSMADTVLLTGGTGFLGTELAARLVRRPQLTLYALVRAADETEAAHRLRNAWHHEAELCGQIGKRSRCWSTRERRSASGRAGKSFSGPTPPERRGCFPLGPGYGSFGALSIFPLRTWRGRSTAE